MQKKISAEAAREMRAMAKDAKLRSDMRHVRALNKIKDVGEYFKAMQSWQKCFPPKRAEKNWAGDHWVL
jgi:hypothetical protein